MSLPHLQDPATPDTNDTPIPPVAPYRQPGVVRILCRELAAAIDRGDYRQAEATRFALNALVESTPPTSAPAPAPVRPGYIAAAWLMSADELSVRIRSYFDTVSPTATFAEAEAHAARCGLVVIR
ncbi:MULTISPECIES: hypothetical protein [Mycobacteriaceae]|uniref:hypothetical protein n=1 Tax=Mycobacteriaceae TaxID=1762 RepID=UPI0007EFCEFB|nr:MULTISPECIES: hypothetical protein [Mycobacteriaceae]MDO2981393.1 hypothetical protein [Mycobacteroides abscessus subsp. abscessus]OBK68043.1 hypothetical protein A5654_15330 [Mycolicibacterium fortuitum]SIH16091.1 Uncharacterised protein [Mycobacteroides abscessus subsp. abscessus]